MVFHTDTDAKLMQKLQNNILTIYPVYVEKDLSVQCTAFFAK
jgi:hypothetical protein